MPSTTLQDCANSMRKILGDSITDADAKSAVIYLKNRSQALAKDTSISLDEAFEMTARELTETTHQNKLYELRQRLDGFQKVKQALDQGDRLKFKADVAVQKLGTQKNRTEFGSAHGVDVLGKLRHMTWLDGFYKELAANDLVGLFESRALAMDKASPENLALSRELWAVNNAEGKATKSVTGNVQMFELARVMDKWGWTANSDAVRYGANIKRTEGYITTQTHSSELIRAAGKDKKASRDAWVDLALRTLDHGRTFGTADRGKLGKILADIHENLYNGYWGRSANDDLIAQNTNFQLSGSLAERMSKQRVLHFASPEAFHEYNAAFGRGTIIQNFMHHLERTARSVALMQEFGPNPADTYRKIVRLSKEKAEKLDDSAEQIDRFAKLGIKEDLGADANWLQATGIADANPGSSIYGGIEAFRSLTKTSALSSSGITSFLTDPAGIASTLRYNGIPWPQAMFSALKGKWLPGQIGKDERAFLESLGFLSELSAGYMVRGLSEANSLARFTHRVSGWVYRWNGLDKSTVQSRQVIALELNRLASANRAIEFDKLPERFAESLRRHKIEAAEWDIIRGLKTENVGGHALFDPTAIRELPSDALRAIAKKEGLGLEARDVARLRDDLWGRWLGYLHGEADLATATPGPDVRKIWLGTSQKNTPSGTALRMVSDLKGFPTAVVMNLVGREFLRKGHSSIADGMKKAGMQPYVHLATFAALATTLGYVSWSAKELLKGRTPPPLIDDEGKFRMDNLLGAMMRGGSIGIIGDFMLSEYDQRSRGFLAQLAGPTIGSAETLYTALKKLQQSGVEGEWISPASEFTRLGESMVPGLNIPWVKLAVGHLFYYSLQEMLSPGIFDRQRELLKASTGQTELGLGMTPWEGEYLNAFSP